MFSVDRFELTEEQRSEISDANETLERLRASRRVHVPASSCVGLVSWAFDSYLQLGLQRIVALGDGIASEWNTMRVVNGVILTRSLIETVSAWWHLLDRARALMQKGDIRGAQELAIKALFGMRYKQPGDEQFPDSTNALTMVDRLDKTFQGVRHFYDSICEIVHPNSAAIFLFGDGDLEKHELILDERRA